MLSLDVFDTLLWRAVARPTDAFLLLGHELAAQQRLNPAIDPYAFRRLRIQAENTAREKHRDTQRGTEVFLEDIWDEIGNNVVTDAEPRRLADDETELERRLTFPDFDIMEIADKARAAGCDVVLVSNTYFSTRRILRLIDRPEMQPLSGSRVFPSCEFGVHKGDGLFKLVLEELDVPPARMLHIGDEDASDVEPAIDQGIRAVHFPKFSSKFRSVLETEGALPPEPLGPSGLVTVPGRGDHGFTALRAKALERTTSRSVPENAGPEWRFGATVLGPVLTGFAEWIHRQARIAEVDTAWCMLREGELLAELVNQAAGYLHSDVVGRPIWLSRHLTNWATLTCASKDELERLVSQRRLRESVSHFAGSLGLDMSELPELRAWGGASLEDPQVADTVLDVLSDDEHIRGRVLAEATAARGRLLRYLERTLGGFPDRLMLVDLGWGGTIQRNLEAIFKSAGIGTRVIGLYLLTNHVATGRIIGGSEMGGYLGHCGEPAGPVGQVSRSPEFVEQACLATVGSVLDFDETGEPILDHSVPPPQQVISKLAVQHGVRAFQQEWRRYSLAATNWLALDGGEAPQLLEILRRSVARPTADEALTFGSWSHEDNCGTPHREHIVAERLARFVPYLSPSDLLEMTMRETFWPLGLAARYDPALAAATVALLEGSVPETTFQASRGSAHMAMWVDCGEGFERPRRRDVIVNRNGLSYGRFSSDGRGIKAIRFDPCDHPALIRLDWIDIDLKIAGSQDVVRLHLSGADDFAGLTYAGCRWLYDGVVFSGTEGPAIHIPLAHRAAGEIYAVDLQVAFSTMRIPAPATPVDLGTGGLPHKVRRAMAKARAETDAGGMMALAQGVARVANRTLSR